MRKYHRPSTSAGGATGNSQNPTRLSMGGVSRGNVPNTGKGFEELKRLIHTKLVEKLDEAGHDRLSASPDSGVDTLTGEGLQEALEGAQVVVDVSNAPAWDDAAVMDFFQTS